MHKAKLHLRTMPPYIFGNYSRAASTINLRFEVCLIFSVQFSLGLEASEEKSSYEERLNEKNKFSFECIIKLDHTFNTVFFLL